MSTRPDIEKANAAKEELLNRYGPILESATIVLGDKGFRLEAVVKARAKQVNASRIDRVKDINGISVTWS